MTRVLAIHGVGLDRAWLELGGEHGELMRRWSADLLAEVAQAVARERADALLVVGDLLDRATVTPSMVEYAAAVLGSVGVPVVVVPGKRDWYGNGSPYLYSSWPESVAIATSSTPEPYLDGRVWASAWTGPTSQPLTLPPAVSEAGPALVVRADVALADSISARLPEGAHLVTSSGLPVDEGSVTSVATAASLEGAAATLLTLTDHGIGTGTVPLGESPVSVTHLDVTGLTDDAQLREAVLAASDGPALIRLVGELAVGVLPPRLHPDPPPPHLVLDEGGLVFRDPEIAPDDHTTQAEFLRGLGGLGLEQRQRHVVTALGLQAMAAVEV